MRLLASFLEVLFSPFSAPQAQEGQLDSAGEFLGSHGPLLFHNETVLEWPLAALGLEELEEVNFQQPCKFLLLFRPFFVHNESEMVASSLDSSDL